MSYNPNQGPGPYQGPLPGQYQQGGQPYPAGTPRDDGANTVANIIRVVTGVITSIFVLHILFVLFDANQGNGFVSFVYTMAKTLVLGLGDVFTPDDAILGVVLNYGFAALVYLVIGHLIIRALRRD